MTDTKLTNPQDWSFSISDCDISLPINPRTGQSYRVGATNGQHDPTPDGAASSRSVTVTHVPTGISVTRDDFLPFRNKELALNELESLVKEWIKKRSVNEGKKK
jgi:protein subunit release factor A